MKYSKSKFDERQMQLFSSRGVSCKGKKFNVKEGKCDLRTVTCGGWQGQTFCQNKLPVCEVQLNPDNRETYTEEASDAAKDKIDSSLRIT